MHSFVRLHRKALLGLTAPKHQMTKSTPMTLPSRPWWKRYAVELVSAVAGLLAMNAILLAGAYWETKKVNPTTAGQLGDFVGGYVGTAFVLLSVLLLYRTLRAQRENTELQSFEARYFELIKLHRENVAEMNVQGISGRRVFLPILRELWAARKIVQNCAAEYSPALTQQQLIHIAYYGVFFGVGPGSSRMFKTSLPEYATELVDDVDRWLQDEETRKEVREEMNLSYVPFEGHQSRLGHYYRHLYQTVRYVQRQQVEIDHYDYVKTIRAQLSTHEQALLLVNSLSPIGAKWWTDGLMLDYRMVKNIPRNFLNPQTHIDVSKVFPQGYFEWEELAGAA